MVVAQEVFSAEDTAHRTNFTATDALISRLFQVKKLVCDWLAKLVFMRRPSSVRSMLARSRPHGDVDREGGNDSGSGRHSSTNGGVGIAMKPLCGPRDTVVVNTDTRRASFAVDLATHSSNHRTPTGHQDYRQRRGTRGRSAGGETRSSECQLRTLPAVSCHVTAYDPHRHDPAACPSSPSKVEADAVDTGGEAGTAAVDALSSILCELRLVTDKLRDDERRLVICSDWKFAAMVVDRFCLILFTVFTIVSTFAILFSAPHVTA